MYEKPEMVLIAKNEVLTVSFDYENGSGDGDEVPFLGNKEVTF